MVQIKQKDEEKEKGTKTYPFDDFEFRDTKDNYESKSGY